MKPNRQKYNDTPLCVLQFILDNPTLSPYQIEAVMPVSAQTVYRTRKAIGLDTMTKKLKPKPDTLAARAGWDVSKAAELIEANGYEMTTREVMALCAVRPWTKQRVREYVRVLKGECVNG